MYRILVTCFFTLLLFQGKSQDLEFKKLDWKKSPTWSELDSSYQDEQEVVLLNEHIIEYYYSEKHNDALVEYVTFHKIIRVLGDDAIQKHNKVYISMGRVVELVEAKARVITPDNKIIDFDESNIQDSESADGLSDHKYFELMELLKALILNIPTPYCGNHTIKVRR